MIKILKITKNEENVTFEVEINKEIQTFQFDINTFNDNDLNYALMIAEKQTVKEAELTAKYDEIKQLYENKEVNLNA